MLYTVSQISENLNVSKQTVYKKLSGLKKELKPFIKMKQGIKCIEEEGVEIIRNSIRTLKDDTVDINDLNDELNVDDENIESEVSATVVNELNELKQEYITSLKERIEKLEEQLNTKDDQLNNKDELLRNFQVLMKQQEQMSTENQKLIGWINNAREEKKSLFSRIFRR